MIFAKINPAAARVNQIDPFTSTTVTGSYMTAIARPYALGAKETRFEVKFGQVEFDENNQVTRYQDVVSSGLTMTSEELANWGSDDSAVLSAIASKLKVTIEEVVSGSLNIF